MRHRADVTNLLPSKLTDQQISPPLLKEHQVAAMLQTSPRALQAWRTRGGGPEFVRIGRLVRYDSVAVNEWLAAGRRRSTSE